MFQVELARTCRVCVYDGCDVMFQAELVRTCRVRVSTMAVTCDDGFR